MAALLNDQRALPSGVLALQSNQALLCPRTQIPFSEADKPPSSHADGKHTPRPVFSDAAGHSDLAPNCTMRPHSKDHIPSRVSHGVPPSTRA